MRAGEGVSMTSVDSNTADRTEPHEIGLHGHRISYRAAGSGPLLGLSQGAQFPARA